MTNKTSTHFVMSMLRDEQDKLLALVISLALQISPKDGKPDDTTDVISWRLLQVLEGRLESTHFLDAVESYLGNALPTLEKSNG